MTYWLPKKATIEEDIISEDAKTEALRWEQMAKFTPIAEPWAPTTPITQPIEEPQPAMLPRRTARPAQELPPVALPQEITEKPEVVSQPFWQRAIGVFTAPFDWVDENIIKPGLGLVGDPLIPDVKREVGEEFWEWKKRSWEEWQSPGVTFTMPWGDWRVDVKGIAELAPWLLIPGAGQVGRGAQVARGIAGILGKAGRVGQVIGTAIEYSPWGMVEKAAGAGIKAVAKGAGGISTAAGEKVFGKLPEPPPASPAVQKLTSFFKEKVMPAREELEAGLPSLRKRQAATADAWLEKGRKGEISYTEATSRAEAARAGGLKEGLAITQAAPAQEVTNISLNDEKMLTPIYDLMGGNKGELFNDLIKYQTPNIEGYDKLLQQIAGQMDSNRKLKTTLIESLRKKGLPDEFMVYHGGGEKPLGKYTNITLDEANAQWFAEMKAGQKVYSYVVRLDDIVGIGDVSTNELFVKSSSLRAGGTKASTIGGFTQGEIDEFLGAIINSTEKGLTTTDTAAAMRALLTGGKGTLPEPHHIKEFAKIYGKEFADTVMEFTKHPLSVREKLLDLANLPRAVLASGDLSAVARQGLILGLTHPTKVPKALWRSLRAFASEKLALDADAVMRLDPDFDDFVRVAEGYIAPIEKGAKILGREEAFASQAAELIPFVRRSERAYITYLNELRLGSYKAVKGSWVAQGAGEEELKMLGKFINVASGRGTLPLNLDQFAPLLNTVMFSPRLQMSRLQLPKLLGQMLISKNPYMRKEAAKALSTFLGGGATILTLLNTSKLAKVESDPRSGDFGKIRMRTGTDKQGNPIFSETRLDVWTGYLQYTRFIAQMMTGERISAYGNMSKAQRDEIAWRFIQSKSSPAFGLVVDLLRGENYMGEKLFQGTAGTLDMARNRFLPLVTQDLMDAFEQGGVNGLMVSAPAFIGVGALTYVNDFARARDKVAKQAGFDSWEETDPKSKRELENKSAELQRAMVEYDRQVMGTAWGDWRLSGNAVEDVFTENVDMAVAKYRETGNGYEFRERIGDAFTARRGGYAAREKEERFSEIVARLGIEDDKEAVLKLGPEQLAIKIYNDALYAEDMYDEFGDYRFDEAETRRVFLREKLGEDLFSYVEDYQGLKYENLPLEFQLLATAKKVLKPYWRVSDEILKIRGEPQTPWQQRRFDEIVGKLRERMRKSDPEMAKYYDMFYKKQT